MRVLVRWFCCGVMLIGLGACTSPAPPRSVGIAPKWMYKASWMARGNPANGLRRPVITTGTTVLLQSYETVVALNRMTGGIRWRRDPVRNLPLRGAVETWREILPAGGDTAIVRVVRSSRVSDPSMPGGYRMEYTDLLQAIESSTGRQLWSISGTTAGDAAASFWPIGIYGNIIVMARRDGRVMFYESARGKRVDPADSAGRDLLRKAALRSPAPLVAPALVSPPALLHVATGTVTRVPVNSGIVSGAFCLESRLILWMAPEKSLESGYLVARDGTGATLWTRGSNSGPTIGMAAALDGAGVLVVRESDGSLAGIAPRDGSVLWRKRLPTMEITSVAPLPDGLFLLATPPGKADSTSLAYVEGKAGAFRWLARIPSSRRIWADSTDVFVLGTDGNLRCYARTALMPQRKTPVMERNGE